MDIQATLELLHINETIFVQFFIAVATIFLLSKFCFEPIVTLFERRYNLTHGSVHVAKELREKYLAGREHLNKEFTDARRKAAEAIRTAENEVKKQISSEIETLKSQYNEKSEAAKTQTKTEMSQLRDKLRPELLDLKKDILGKLVNE